MQHLSARTVLLFCMGCAAAWVLFPFCCSAPFSLPWCPGGPRFRVFFAARVLPCPWGSWPGFRCPASSFARSPLGSWLPPPAPLVNKKKSPRCQCQKIIMAKRTIAIWCSSGPAHHGPYVVVETLGICGDADAVNAFITFACHAVAALGFSQTFARTRILEHKSDGTCALMSL